jgi:hypothetical protein
MPAGGLAIVLLAGALLVPDLLRRALGPPRIVLTEIYQEKPGAPTIDHSALDGLLRKHVAPGGWVNYRALRTRSHTLDRYLESLVTIPLEALGRSERLALMINGYNAFTLRLILDHEGIRSIKDIPAAQRWDAARWRIGPLVLSLNQIEHEQIRPRFREPRIHFALVCAAVGCPPLRSEAYTGGRLEELLADQTRLVHGSQRWFRYDGGAATVHLTSLYRWYEDDFGQVAGSVMHFASRHSSELGSALTGSTVPRIEWIPYGWSLNTLENRR